ncbi:MFS-type transporter SLC18B1-like isoform X2 [Acropora millepora]|uniref:MFS-type transporter SLC18B1-like isoform X2 n=1 Tax=Acropora millepora TaxID=45264 RepID=UPI001CF28659|nr:MFS-type transporter SLC18B1-like isoform X2 [Acropora millepora]
MEALTGQAIWTVRKTLILLSLFLVYFLLFAGFAVYVPFFPSKARDKGVSETVIGLIFGIYPLVIFVFSPFLGYLIQRYGPPFVLFTGIFLFGGSNILFGFCGMISGQTLFVVFCFLLRTTSAMGGAAAETSALSIVMEQFPDNLGAVTGASETFSGIGFSLGPALGGFLYEIGGFKLPFIVMGCSAMAALPLLMILLNNRERPRSRDLLEKSTSFFKAMRIPGIFILALCYVIIGLSFSYFDPILGPYLKKLGQRPTMIGLMFLIYSGTYALSAPIIGWSGDRMKCFRCMLLFGFTGLAVGFFLLGPSPFLNFLPANKIWWVYTVLPINGLSGGFCFVPIMPEMIRTARANGMPDNSSTYAVLSSIFGSMYNLGATIGPFISGICDEHFGFQWAMSVAGFICLSHAVLLVVFTLYEYVVIREHVDNRLLDEEGN